jgi:2-polyprenyl-6-methoxyphenol hydroxylase-like FAD-dependent oxidoreductase
MLPFGGQGAAQGIEDALTLADALDGHAHRDRHDDLSSAFDAYESERKPGADRIRAESRRLGLLGTMQSRVATRLRNRTVELLPEAVFRWSRRRRASHASLPEPTARDRSFDA